MTLLPSVTNGFRSQEGCPGQMHFCGSELCAACPGGTLRSNLHTRVPLPPGAVFCASSHARGFFAVCYPVLPSHCRWCSEKDTASWCSQQIQGGHPGSWAFSEQGMPPCLCTSCSLHLECPSHLVCSGNQLLLLGPAPSFPLGGGFPCTPFLSPPAELDVSFCTQSESLGIPWSAFIPGQMF